MRAVTGESVLGKWEWGKAVQKRVGSSSRALTHNPICYMYLLSAAENFSTNGAATAWQRVEEISYAISERRYCK